MLCLAQREVHTDVNATAERRRGFRISQSRPIKIYDAANTGRFIDGQTRNVSATGLRIELPLDSDVTPGSLINVAVAPTDSLSISNRRGLIAARVIWTHRDFRNGLTAGIEFITGIMTQRRAA